MATAVTRSTPAPAPAMMALQAPQLGLADDELLALFRRVTISGSAGHDVSETQIKKAFEQEVSRPLGRQVLEASLRDAHECSCYHWNYHDRIRGKVDISRVDLSFDLTSQSMGQSVRGEVAGFFRVNHAYINATVYYDDQQTLQGNQSIKVYMDANKFIIDFYPTDQAEKPIARIVQTNSSFTFQGTCTGDSTWYTN
ncbi:uncharacterized protein BO66DRAFT_346849 [Aspergillus aculeatinus CBS 121060]|uniref:Uncharacterized protein n=2 Tax=Aspergillus TaxID=5052 RepID=A0A8G1S3B7_9EURO|nr:hypothetical protein BO66DRAFT_346849 [Aspergillus aculeatinus CBS 121060]XP_040806761.1 uncharacterized protein BO72DRAFT_9309 [Aspergillus fijiensis CBS 313.89]RAH71520.1 hypothetical protein BO66DRAFT_346849 [Aspergillus aculeatinus CBS 121060]RAK82751.1 hypothetical protein BO72DRAFT_9309 [Aspergillus fijiensis CBS 313.89]